MSRLRTHQLAHKDINTAYHDEGSGPVFLLVHGFTGSKLDFHDQISWFSGNHRVIAIDNRGHGESTNSGDQKVYTIDSLADDLHSVVAALGIEQLHLLGHSLGGMVALRYVLARPESVSSLLLMDTSSAPLNLPESMREMMSDTLANEGAAALTRMMRLAPTSDAVQNGIDFLGEDEHWARIEEKLSQMDPAAIEGLGSDFGRQQDITPALASITCPTTVLVGEADLPFIEPSKKMAATFPDARLEILPDAAHCPQYENAARWREILVQHLSRNN